uniref:Uncharacterized protein n=1 Tax=Oncorhynchus kisutch TaxID=8019 RepID=A0A8C7MSH0_ONCKI
MLDVDLFLTWVRICVGYTAGRLKLTVLSQDRLQMKWKEAEGPVQGYKVRVKPISGEPPELMLTTTRGRATVAGLDSSQEYALQVLVLNGTLEKLIAKRRFTSKRRQGRGSVEQEGEARRKNGGGENECRGLKRGRKKEKDLVSTRKAFECDTTAAADMVMLVDGSWSIGRTNFRRVRDFLEGLVTPFHIGPDRVQIALSQYSGDPRTEWQLNNFTTKEQLLEAVRNFRYKGGNTFTGQALLHVLEENLRHESGARPDTPRILILLTDGKSQDDAIAAANRLKNTGVEIIAVGVKNADESELRQVASEPLEINVYNVNDFPLLSKLVDRLVHILCGKIEERSIAKSEFKDPVLYYPSPTDLEFSELGPREVQLSWTGPTRPVLQYRVVFHSAEGQSPQEVVVNGTVSSVLLGGLSSQTHYHISIFPVYDDNVGLALRGTITTLPLAMPEGLEVTPSSPSSLRVRWGATAGATQYMVLYSSLSHGEPDDAKEVKFGADQTDVMLGGLIPVTDYSVTLYALYDEDPSDPVTAIATTYPLPSPVSMQFPKVSHSMVRVSWVPGVVDVPGHRITCSTNHGSDVKQVEVTGVNSVLLQNLSSLSRYLVSVQSQYEQGLSSPLTANVTTLRVPAPSDLRVTNFSGSDITVRWESAADDVVSYLIKWISLSGGDLRQLRVDGDSEGAILEGVQDDKEYQISLSALYADGAQSEAVAIRYSTLSGGGPSSVSISEETAVSLLVSWVPPNAHVGCYSVMPLQVLVSGSERRTLLQTLLPDTRYSILVTAEYRNREGGSASAQGKTKSVCVSASGFDMMEAFGLTQRAYSSVEGVAAEPFVFNTLHTYTVYRDIQLTQSTGFIHPAGFSPEHTISIAFRLLQDTPREPFALWQLTDNDFQPKMGVVLDPVSKLLLYFSLDYRGEVQELTFDQPQVHRLFYGSFHKIHLSISQVSVSLSVDCQHVGERPARPLGTLPTDGFETLGKLMKTRGPHSGSAPFQLQSFEIVCNTTWALEDTCCDLPGLRDEESCPAPAYACTCTSDIPGAPGVMGPPVSHSGEPQSMAMIFQLVTQACEQLVLKLDLFLNEMSRKPVPIEEPVGPPGEPGIPGGKGPPGQRGNQGRLGTSGEPGKSGYPGEQGAPGEKGSLGPNVQGPQGIKGFAGLPGEAKLGSPGPRGEDGQTGPPGIAGAVGQAGEIGPPGVCDSSGCHRGAQTQAGTTAISRTIYSKYFHAILLF